MMMTKDLTRCMTPEELVNMKRLQLELLTGMVKSPGKVRGLSLLKEYTLSAQLSYRRG